LIENKIALKIKIGKKYEKWEKIQNPKGTKKSVAGRT
jgi:hypothetical protein